MPPEPTIQPCPVDPPCPHPRHVHDEFADNTYGDCWMCGCRGNRQSTRDTTKTFDMGGDE